MQYRLFYRVSVLLVITAFLSVSAPTVQAAEPFAVEYYYKVKWGHYDEFLRLYKKNHYPVLVKLKEMGVIVDMSAHTPVHHGAEEKRWDFRYTIVYKDAATAHDEDPDQTRKIVQELYPDQETFQREEQRRFQLLIEHMDVPVGAHDLSKWPTKP